MATLLFHTWSHDHPFDPMGRCLQEHGGEKPTRSEKRSARQREKANQRWEREHGETIDEAEARRTEEKQAEQARLAQEMNELIASRIDAVGSLNAEQVKARIEAKKSTGELNGEQLANMDEALAELQSIHQKRESGELTTEAYAELLRQFNGSHLDLLLSESEIQSLRSNVDARLKAHEENMERVEKARETQNLSELEELALAFTKEENTGEHPEVGGDRLKPGATYIVDFHNPDGSLNRYAHQKVTLGHILKGTGLKKVEVEKANGFTTDAYLWPDGRTYMNAPWEAEKGQYVGIVSGDKFRVLEDSYATAPQVDEAAQIREMQSQDVAREKQQFDIEVAHDDREALQEAEGILDGSYKVDIPADVARLKGADLEKMLRGMDMGDTVIRITEELAGLPGSVAEGSGTSLFIEMMEKGGNRTLALKEITKVIFGVNGEKFLEQYKETQKEAETLRWTEFYIVQEKTANPEMTWPEFYEKLKDAQGDDADRVIINKYPGEVKTMFDGYQAGQTVDTLNRPNSVQAVMSARSVHKKFLLGAHRLLKAVPLMKAGEYADTNMDRSLPKSSELKDVAEPALASIFPPNEGAPMTKRGIWDSVTRRHGDSANMGNMGERVKYDQEKQYQKLFTSLYAYNEIRSQVTRIENGVEVVDLTLLAQTLEKYRQQGKILMDKKMMEERRDSGRRVMYPDEPITVETLSNMGALSAMTVELIQHGMMVEQMKEYGKLKEKVIQSFPAEIREQLSAMNGQYEFTPQELQEIGENIRVCQVTMLHFTQSEMRHLNQNGNLRQPNDAGRPVNEKERNIGATQTFTVFEKDGNRITLSMGINYNKQWDEAYPESTVQTFNFQLGPSYTKTFGAEERNHLTLSAGVTGPISGGEQFWGAGGSLSFRHDWGEYKTWSSGVSVSAGAPIEAGTPFLESLALIHAGLTIVDINQDQVIVKRASEAYEQNKEYYDQQMALLDQKFDQEMGSLDQLSPQQLAHVKEQVMDYYKQELIFGVIDDMSLIRFDKIGVEAIAHPPYVLVRFGIAIKGKTQMFYVKPDNFDMEGYASRLLSEKAKEAGAEGYELLEVSGDMVVTEAGERTYVRSSNEAYDPYGDIDAANDYFMEQVGVKVERIPNSGEFRLLPLRVDGLVEVYADENEGIRVYPGSDGEFYFSIPAGTDLAIHRHTHAMPLPDGGVQEITRIYITDNPQKTADQVAKSTTHHAEAYVSQREGGRNSKAEERQHILAEQVVTNYEPEIGEWNIEEVKSAQEQLDRSLNAYGGAGIDTARFQAMETAVNRYKEAGRLKIDAAYRGNNEAYAKALLEKAQPLMRELGIQSSNSAEITALLQLILIADRSDAPESTQEFIDHIDKWNRASIEQSLRASGIEAGMAGQMARKISAYYAIRLLQEGQLPETKVERSAIVHTHIGRMPQGNVMQFVNGMQDSVGLQGAMKVDEALLTHEMQLTSEEVQALQASLAEQMAPMNLENPDLLFQNPIALSVLESGAMIFGPDYAKALSELAQSEIQSATGLTGVQKDAYEAFLGVMKTLSTQPGPGIKTAEYAGRPIRVRVDMQIGFLHKCRNFTSTYKVDRIQMAGGQAARTMDYVNAQAAVNFYGAEAAVGMSVQEKSHPPQNPPEDESDKDGNNALGDDRDDLTGGNFDGTGGSNNGANGNNSGESGIFD